MDAVAETVLEAEGVTEGVSEGVIDGVAETVLEAEGVTDAVAVIELVVLPEGVTEPAMNGDGVGENVQTILVVSDLD
jgi:hypothetical protein